LPDGSKEVLEYAQAQENIGYPQYALIAYEAVLPADRKNGALVHSIGNCHFQLGDTDKARTYYELALNMADESNARAASVANLDISTTYFYDYNKQTKSGNSGIKSLKKAGDFAKAALACDDTNASAHKSYALYQKYYAGKFKNPTKKKIDLLLGAKDGFLKASQLGYIPEILNIHLAEIFSDLEKPIDARFHSEEALLDGVGISRYLDDEGANDNFSQKFPKIAFTKSVLYSRVNDVGGSDPNYKLEIDKLPENQQNDAPSGSEPG
ncbi:MAG: tetratricopeptide repeat protein, partial [Pseudomonadota bacterium]